jgi:TonB-linked SusC/RagA family outer membrane protein
MLIAQKTVTGTISDASGLLPGVSIVEKGTGNGVETDFEGFFTIKVSKDNAILSIRYLGYKVKEVSVLGKTKVAILIEEDAEQLDEIVINALGFQEKKDKQGSTSSVVKTKTIVRSGEATLANALSGKASGLKISRSNGDPGAGSTIRIRGANTIGGSSDPLIIIDGVPLDNTTSYAGGNGARDGGVTQGSRFNDINPADIATVQILKGASAAALWGSSAANGVIVITTKEGKKGNAKITYNSTYSFDQISERIDMQSDYGQGTGGVYRSGNRDSWGDYIPNRSGEADGVNTSGAFFTADDGTVYYPITAKNSKDTFLESNWDSAFQTGSFLQNDLTISGGGEKNNYFFSLSNISQDGIIKNSSYDRTNLRFNYTAKLNDWITLSNKVAYTYTDSNRIQQSSNVAGIMLGLLRTSPDFDVRDYKGTYTNSAGVEEINRHRSYRKHLGETQNPTYNNPLWTVNEQVSRTFVNRFTITPQLTIKPTNWLQVITRANVDTSSDRRVYFFPISSAGEQSVGQYQEDEIGTRVMNFDAIGKTNFDLTSDITLNTTIGWTINDRTYIRNSGNITGFLVNSTKQTTSLNTSAEASSFESSKSLRRNNRGYAVMNFDMYDQLFVNFSGGIEASSTINGTFFYPAVDLAWDFSKDAVKSDFLSFGKFRTSFGKVGVQPSAHKFETLAEGGFGYSTYSDPLSIDLFGGGFRLDNNLGNPNLKPEIKTEWEIGADLRFLNDDLSFSFTYYSNKIDGILLDVNLSPSTGFATQYGNYGKMKNNGLEFDLGWNAVDKEDFKISTTLNWSRNINEVTDLFGTESISLSPGASVSSRAVVGYPLGVLFGTGSKTLADGSLDLNANGFPQITSEPIVLGDPNPDWRAGLGLSINYKKFNLNVVVEHSQGGDFSPRTLWVLRAMGTTQETAARVTLDRDLTNFAGNTIASGTTLRGSVTDFGAGPVLLDESWYRSGIGGGFGDNQAYNFSIKDATFTKVRELSLSYILDQPWLKHTLGLSNVLLTATGRNLININKIPGIDPEVNQYGVGNALGLDYFTNPQTKSFLFSVSFNF